MSGPRSSVSFLMERRRRVLRAAVLLAVCLAPLPAVAAPRGDVADIRAGKLPVRHEWLGWEGPIAHFRIVVCSDGGTVHCTVAFRRERDGSTPAVTTVLDEVEVNCGVGSCPLDDPKVVAKFLAQDARAVAALPAGLTRTPEEKDPASVFGTVAGEATRVEIRAVDATTSPDEGPRVSAQLVVRGKGGAVEPLVVLDKSAFRLNSSKLVAAHVSPDGARVAIVARTNVGVMCWDFDALSPVVLDVRRHRASLANTIGFSAYKKGDLATAKSAFVEATAHDPSFGLGWFNRAAVESRAGDVASASSSLKRALGVDPAFAKRACKDRDFDPLRKAEPSLVACP
jgi:hypothetical protein